jgi:hypothetical protein
MENVENVIDINSEDEVDHSTPVTPARRLSGEASSTTGSFVWSHFTKDTDYKNNKKAKCEHCNKTYVCTGGSTSGLTKHLRNVHNIIKTQEQTSEVNVLTMLQAPKVNIFYIYYVYIFLNFILLIICIYYFT